ncbi:hypothetical protein COOONC_00167 [Cooperia oncophora]
MCEVSIIEPQRGRLRTLEGETPQGAELSLGYEIQLEQIPLTSALFLYSEMNLWFSAEIWKDKRVPGDGKDALALRAARKFFIIDAEPLNSTTKFVADVLTKMKQPPYNCQDCTSVDPAVAQVGEVADAMLMYALALNKSIAKGNLNPTGAQISDYAVGSFDGFTGKVIINVNNTRDPVFYVWGLNSTDQQIVMMKIVGTVTAEGIVVSLSLQHSISCRGQSDLRPLS